MRCAECGYDYDDHREPGVVTELGNAARDCATRLRAAAASDPAPNRTGVLRRRPDPDVWSALDYACHVRDVLLTQRERILAALVEDGPSFTPMYREQRVVSARYADEDPVVVADQIDTAGPLVVHVLAGFDDDAWQRQCVHNFPTPTTRTLAWVASHTLHEVSHHLGDIDRALGGSGVATRPG